MLRRLLQQHRCALATSAAEQHRNTAATRAAETVSQRSRDARCNIATALLRHELQQCELAALQCSAAACHRRSASLHRCSAAPLPTIAATATKLGTFDVSWTSIRGTSVHRLPFIGPASCCPAPHVLPPYALLSCRLAVLRPAILRPAFSSNIYLTSVQYLCVTGYSQQRTLFFKLYVVLEFCS